MVACKDFGDHHRASTIRVACEAYSKVVREQEKPKKMTTVDWNPTWVFPMPQTQGMSDEASFAIQAAHFAFKRVILTEHRLFAKEHDVASRALQKAGLPAINLPPPAAPTPTLAPAKPKNSGADASAAPPKAKVPVAACTTTSAPPNADPRIDSDGDVGDDSSDLGSGSESDSSEPGDSQPSSLPAAPAQVPPAMPAETQAPPAVPAEIQQPAAPSLRGAPPPTSAMVTAAPAVELAAPAPAAEPAAPDDEQIAKFLKDFRVNKTCLGTLKELPLDLRQQVFTHSWSVNPDVVDNTSLYFTEFMKKLRNPTAPKSPLGGPRSTAPKPPVAASDASGSKEVKPDKHGEDWAANKRQHGDEWQPQHGANWWEKRGAKRAASHQAAATQKRRPPSGNDAAWRS